MKNLPCLLLFILLLVTPVETNAQPAEYSRLSERPRLAWLNVHIDPLHFLALEERSILKARRAIDSLKERLEAWRYQPHSFPPAPAEMRSIDEPNFPEITSVPGIKIFTATVFKVAAKFAFYGAFLGYAFGRSWLGVSYMAGVVFLITVLDELPKTFKGKVVTAEPPFKAPNYEPGSWTDSNTEINPN